MKSKKGPIQATRRINIKAQFMFRFSAKRSLKSPAKPSKRTGPGYPEAARGPGSSGLGRDTQRLPEARDPQVMQHSYCGIETAQEMKNKDVLLKYPVVQQRIRKYKANIHEQRSCTTRNQE